MPIGLLVAAVIAASPPSGGVLSNEQVVYDKMLATQVIAADRAFGGLSCDDAKTEVVGITPWKITDHPDVIVWRERVRVSGCGRSSVENVNVGRMGGDPPWRMTTGLPGETLTDMTLQQSTLPSAAAQARADLPAVCQGQTLGDIYIAARPGGVDVSLPGTTFQSRDGRPSVSLPDSAGSMLDKLDLSGAWMEAWPFQECGHDRTLGVVFIPQKDRTATLFLFLPVWQQIAAHGPGARPAPAPPS